MPDLSRPRERACGGDGDVLAVRANRGVRAQAKSISIVRATVRARSNANAEAIAIVRAKGGVRANAKLKAVVIVLRSCVRRGWLG